MNSYNMGASNEISITYCGFIDRVFMPISKFGNFSASNGYNDG